MGSKILKCDFSKNSGPTVKISFLTFYLYSCIQFKKKIVEEKFWEIFKNLFKCPCFSPIFERNMPKSWQL